MRYRISIGLLVALLGVLGACKRTEEGESRQWDRAVRELGELSAVYPGFKAALDEVKGGAEAAMSAAQKLSDKEARIAAMAKANQMLTTGFVDGLSKVDERLDEIRKQLVRLAGDATTEEEKRAFEEAKKQVDKALADVEATLRRGARDVAAATALVRDATKNLDFARDALKQIGERIAARKRSEKAAADEKTASEAAADQAAKDAVAPWTCEYCSHENPHDADKCSNCGAPRNADDKKAP